MSVNIKRIMEIRVKYKNKDLLLAKDFLELEHLAERLIDGEQKNKLKIQSLESEVERLNKENEKLKKRDELIKEICDKMEDVHDSLFANEVRIFLSKPEIKKIMEGK